MNKDVVKINIRNKTQYAKAYYANDKTITTVPTDMDEFPYQRWYRGISTSNYPVIIEREAGYHVVQEKEKVKQEKSEYPRHVFAAACSTVLPVYAKEGINKSVASQFCVDKFL